MRVVSLEDDNTISLSKDIQYSINGNDWQKLYAGNQITVNRYDIVYFKGTNTSNSFTVSKEFNVEGNIMSLLYGDNFEGQIDLIGKNNAFYNLFYNCTELKNAENLILPATTLSDFCYDSIFVDCTSLTTAPELPATILAESCYYHMFYGCTSLNNITMLETDISVIFCLESWVNGVASTGTFTKSPSMASLPSGVHGIPNGWTVENA